MIDSLKDSAANAWHWAAGGSKAEWGATGSWPNAIAASAVSGQTKRDMWSIVAQGIAKDAGLAGEWNNIQRVDYSNPKRTLPRKGSWKGLTGGNRSASV